MRNFTGKSKIVGIQIAEIRVREIGRAPSVMAKLAFMTSTGESAGMYIQHMFSDRTRALLQELYASMEDDASSLLSEDPPSSSHDRQEYSSDDPDDGDEMSYR